MEEDVIRITAEAQVYRMIGFNGFDTAIIPSDQLADAAVRQFIGNAQANPAPLADGCLVCHSIGEHRDTDTIYCAYLVDRQDDQLDLTFVASPLCHDHGHQFTQATIDFNDTGKMVTLYELSSLRDHVMATLAMPDAIYCIEIELGNRVTTTDLMMMLIDSARN